MGGKRGDNKPAKRATETPPDFCCPLRGLRNDSIANPLAGAFQETNARFRDVMKERAKAAEQEAQRQPTPAEQGAAAGRQEAANEARPESREDLPCGRREARHDPGCECAFVP